MDRAERMMELLAIDHVKFSDEHKQLLTAQVVLTDRMDRLATTMQELAEAQKHTDERLGILVHIGGRVYSRPRQDLNRLILSTKRR